MSGIVTNSFGGTGGSGFGKVLVKDIGLSAGRFVDQIRINGETYGGGGGDDKGTLKLGTEEYICKVDIHSGRYVDYVEFTTNHERTVSGGGTGGGGKDALLNNIRVISIGGKSGKYVDRLEIMYCEDYKPSVKLEDNVGFILDYSPPFEVIEEYTESLYKTRESYEKTTSHMVSHKYSASVKAEYFVQASASTEITVKTEKMEDFQSDLETGLEKGKKTKQRIPKGYVGVLLANATLMKSADDTIWMYPTEGMSYSVISISDSDNLLQHYDLTGELHTQVPGLKDHKIIKNGYVYYDKSPT